PAPEGGAHGTGEDARPRTCPAQERQVIGRREKGAHEDRHRAGPDGAEERVHALGAVRENDEDALLLLHAEPAEGGGRPGDALAELPVGDVHLLRVRPKTQGDASRVAATQDLGGDVRALGIRRHASLERTYRKSIGW